MKIFLILITSLLLNPRINIDGASKNDVVSEKSVHSSLRGKIIEEKTGESLIGVEVEIIGTGISAYTDMEGEFEFTGLDLQTQYSLKISYISYKNKIIRGLNPGEPNLMIELQSQSLPQPSQAIRLHPGT